MSATHSDELERRMRFLMFEEQDAAHLRALREVAAETAPQVVERFYAHLTSHEETRRHFQNEKHLVMVKKTQSAYFARLFDGVYDQRYLEDRVRVGKAHERIGLEPLWYIGGYSLYLGQLIPIILEHHAADPKRATAALQSVVKLVCFDMSVAIDTYIDAIAARESEQVHTFVKALGEIGEQLTVSSNSILGATTAQTASAQQQATAVSEVTATLSELRQTSSQALERAEGVITQSDLATEASQAGGQAVEAATQAMGEIRDQVEAIAGRIVSLSEQTQAIGDIITSVNEIAEQSKLLALNAAIEAARAGDHGKGFAVVAAEIRSLADQSKQATARVRKILGDIQAATNSAVVATEEGTKRVEAGSSLAKRAGETIHMLGDSVEESAGSARLIANASRQQTTGIQQVADAVVSIQQATMANVAGLRQTEDSAKQLDALTRTVNELVDTFSKPRAKSAEYRLA